MVVKGLVQSGVRAIVHQGWARLGEGLDVPESIFLLDKPVAHDWLFPLCAAVCHHGGAGTVATGLQCGKPTMVVPFFGDQPFWGERIASMGLGPDPVPHEELTPEKLLVGIQYCMKPEVCVCVCVPLCVAMSLPDQDVTYSDRDLHFCFINGEFRGSQTQKLPPFCIRFTVQRTAFCLRR